MFQDPYGSLNPRKKVGSILEEPLKVNTDLGAEERRARVRRMLAHVGLRPEHYARYPHMFSGGQRQRIAVARALMLNPKIVILDEPVSALDVSIQAQVLNLLNDLQDEFHLAYLLISHDLSVVRHVADEVIVMYLGRPIEHGSRAEVFETPLHPYTRALQASSPSTDPRHRSRRLAVKGELPSPLAPPPGCAFHPRCPFANERCRIEVPKLQFYPGTTHLHACHAVEEGRLPDLPAPPALRLRARHSRRALPVQPICVGPCRPAGEPGSDRLTHRDRRRDRDGHPGAGMLAAHDLRDAPSVADDVARRGRDGHGEHGLLVRARDFL